MISSIAPGCSDAPKISVIIPVKNCAKYVEQTLESLAQQTYKNFEVLIMDGLSTDGTLEKIELYRERINFSLLSEKDESQVYAINKGFSLAKGEIIGWLNADDLLEPDALASIVSAIGNIPQGFTYGHFRLIDSRGAEIKKSYVFPMPLDLYQSVANLFQGTVWFRRELYEQFGPLDVSLKVSYEYKLFDEFMRNGKGVFIDKILASYRLHGGSISHNMHELALLEIVKIRPQVSRLKIASLRLKKILIQYRSGVLAKTIFERLRYYKFLMFSPSIFKKPPVIE